MMGSTRCSVLQADKTERNFYCRYLTTSIVQTTNETFLQKTSVIGADIRKVIVVHDNDWPFIIRVIKDTLLELEWDFLPQSAYSPDMTPSGVITYSHRCSMAWPLSGFEMLKKCGNGSTIGSLPSVLCIPYSQLAKKMWECCRRWWKVFSSIYILPIFPNK